MKKESTLKRVGVMNMHNDVYDVLNSIESIIIRESGNTVRLELDKDFQGKNIIKPVHEEMVIPGVPNILLNYVTGTINGGGFVKSGDNKIPVSIVLSRYCNKIEYIVMEDNSTTDKYENGTNPNCDDIKMGFIKVVKLLSAFGVVMYTVDDINNINYKELIG